MSERMAKAYWNAFRDGLLKVAGMRPQDYPTWDQSTDPVKQETVRCMRHAAEELRVAMIAEHDCAEEMFGHHFPTPPQPRKLKRIPNDDAQVASQRIARLNG